MALSWRKGELWIIDLSPGESHTIIQNMFNKIGSGPKLDWLSREDQGAKNSDDPNLSRIETGRDASELALYIMRTGRDYDEHPAVFWNPPVGMKLDRQKIADLAIWISKEPENKGKVVYTRVSTELWKIIEGEIVRTTLRREETD
jgi:hypothetical protein